MAHNGGRTQLNMDGLDGPMFLHIEHQKAGTDWQAGTTDYPAITNARGYPQSTPTTRFRTEFPIPNTVSQYSGSWIVDWEGEGEIQVAGGGYTVTEGDEFADDDTTNNLTASGVEGRVKFTFNSEATSCVFYIQDSASGDPIRNIRFYRADHESRLQAGEKWNPDALAVLRELNPGVLRFLDWIGANNGNATTWTHRGNTADFSYAQRKWLPECWVGGLTGTDTYTCDVPSGNSADWAHGEIIQCQVVNANTDTAPTLQPTGYTGAKVIKNMQAAALTAGELAANELLTLIYDEDLDCLLYHSGGIFCGMPHELMVDLCNTLGAHGWVCFPPMVNDDYYTQAATIWRDNLDSALRWYAEWSNEVWNFVFTHTHWASRKGEEIYGVTSTNNRNYHAWYANRFINMADLIAVVGGNYRRVIAVQAVGDGAQYDTYRFKGTDLSVSEPNRPIDKCEALSFATYFQGANFREFSATYANPLDDSVAATDDLLGAADDYASGTPSLMEAALSYVDNDVRQGEKSSDGGSGANGRATLEGFEDVRYLRWHAYAVTYDVRLIEYEAALALGAPTEAKLTDLGHDTAYRQKILDLAAAYKHDPRAKQITLDRYNGFLSLSNAEFPSQLGVVQASANPWTLKFGNLYSDSDAVAEAIAEFNAVSSSGLLREGRARPSRRRLFVDLEDRLVEVSGVEEAERLFNQLKKEEKAQEKDRKRLKILLGKAESAPVGIYKAQEKIQALEMKMDDRDLRIENLATVIQQKLDEINEDDEEVMLL